MTVMLPSSLSAVLQFCTVQSLLAYTRQALLRAAVKARSAFRSLPVVSFSSARMPASSFSALAALSASCFSRPALMPSSSVTLPSSASSFTAASASCCSRSVLFFSAASVTSASCCFRSSAVFFRLIFCAPNTQLTISAAAAATASTIVTAFFILLPPLPSETVIMDADPPGIRHFLSIAVCLFISYPPPFVIFFVPRAKRNSRVSAAASLVSVRPIRAVFSPLPRCPSPVQL